MPLWKKDILVKLYHYNKNTKEIVSSDPICFYCKKRIETDKEIVWSIDKLYKLYCSRKCYVVDKL